MNPVDHVVEVIHETYERLPRKSKPRDGGADGVAEWIPLSGICLCSGEEVRCIALGWYNLVLTAVERTGMKCLPVAKVASANGLILHDWHAEVLAMRAFNRFLLDECSRMSSGSLVSSKFLSRNSSSECDTPPFTVDPRWRIVMYCSEAPCGDASIEIVMGRQEDATPWPVEEGQVTTPQLLGQGSFSQLGIVRRKPSRPDSPATLSKSCSDKLAMKQYTSLLSAVTAALVSPENAYIDKLILPQAQFVPAACERAFGPGGRMKGCVGEARDGSYAYRPFMCCSTPIEFRCSRETISSVQFKCQGSNIATVWTPDFHETLVNGVLQGRKQGDVKGASRVSRRHMGRLLGQISGTGVLPTQVNSDLDSYRAIKTITESISTRQRIKALVVEVALTGWSKNAADDFRLEWDKVP